MRGAAPGPFFRGAERSRLVVLAALGIGLAGLAYLAASSGQRPAAPPPRAGALPPLPPSDPSEELQGLQDRVPMTSRDNAAYRLLLDRVRETDYKTLHAQARRDVVFSQLFEAPGRYRGLPLHVEGVARRVLVQHVEGSHVFESGRYYEAYVFTADSMRNPYILAFEQAPANLAIGDDVSQRIEFDGYFLKLMAYLAGDGKYRAAPLIVGRFPPAANGPNTTAPAAAPAPRGAFPRIPSGYAWLFVVLVAYTLYRVTRVVRGLGRRTLPTWRPRPVNETIEPEELSAWLGREEAGEDGAEAGPDGRRTERDTGR